MDTTLKSIATVFYLALLMPLAPLVASGQEPLSDHDHAGHEGLPCGDCYETGFAEFLDETGQPTGQLLGEHSFNPACASGAAECPLEGTITGPIDRSCDGEGTDFRCHNGAVSGLCEDSHYDPPCQELALALSDVAAALKKEDAALFASALATHESLRMTDRGVEVTECDNSRIWLDIPESISSTLPVP